MGARQLTMAACAVVAAVACEQAKDPVGATGRPAFAPAFAFSPGNAINHFEVEACKTGPAGTYNFTIAALTGDVTLPLGGSFTLDAGQCAVVATTTGNAQKVRISEVNLPAGTLFDHVDQYLFVTTPSFPVSGVPALNSKSTSATVDVGNFGNDAGWAVNFVNVAAPGAGCTLTQGYWKTHNNSFKGGAPTDPTWALIQPSAEQSPFFLSGTSWFGVFQIAPAGNAYYQLAPQYMAAVLNKLAGAGSTAAVDAAISTATTLFNTYTPAQIGALKGNNSLRQQFIALAGTLDNYNSGLTGPGHCN